MKRMLGRAGRRVNFLLQHAKERKGPQELSDRAMACTAQCTMVLVGVNAGMAVSLLGHVPNPADAASLFLLSRRREKLARGSQLW